MLHLLRRRNFALFWTSGLVSYVGDWVLLTALPFYVYELTGWAVATGAMFIVQTLPPLLLGSVAGVYADRWNRKHIMVIADVTRGAVLLPLLLVRSAESVWLVYVVGFVEACISQFAAPAEAALLPTLVEEKDLVPANSLNAMNDNLARLAGPALGGLLMTKTGLPLVVLADMASYFISALLIVFLQPPSQPSKESQSASVWAEWVAGLKLLTNNRPLTLLFAVTAAAVVAEGILSVLLVPFVKVLLGGAAQELGWLMTARGAGGILGGLLVGHWATGVSPGRLLPAGLAGCGAVILGMVSFRSLPAGLVLLAVVGFPAMAFLIGAQTLLQLNTPDAFRGRVSGCFGTTLALASLAGMGLGSALGDTAGVAAMFGAAGIIYLLVAVAAWSGFHGAG